MRKTFLIISIFFIFFGCKEVKKQIEKFNFDSSKILQVCSFKYNYKLGRKISATEIDYIYTSDKGTISDTTQTIYLYNKNGFIEREISKCSTESNSEIKIYSYDSKDSLMTKLTINSNGDTTFWEEFKNFADSRKKIFERYILLDIKSFEEFKNAHQNKKYDTTIIKTEYIYDKNLCKELKVFDKTNHLIRSTVFEYNDGKVYKELHYAFYNSNKILNTKYYDYKKNEINPDYYSLDSHGDTAEKLTNEYVAGKLVLSIMVNDYGKDSIKVFYENGKKIGDIHYSKKLSRKSYYSYTYNDNGDIKEEKYYPEEIK